MSGWSNNISEEREAADHICNTTKICPLLSLAVYLEVMGQYNNSHVQLDYEVSVNANDHRVSHNGLYCVFNNTEFSKTNPGNLGTYSCRKWPADYAIHSGCSCNYVNIKLIPLPQPHLHMRTFTDISKYSEIHSAQMSAGACIIFLNAEPKHS
jgi:hypothetical protein